ncbi:hypothetical protein Q7P35_008034 [Cladosporium inversicolor]
MVETLQPTALGLIILWPSLATIIVALRVYTRIWMRQFYLDDYIVVVAWSLALGQTVMVYLYSLKSWQGYHYYDIPRLSVEDRMQASRYDLANQLLYNPILALVKASIIFFLWRLGDKRKAIRWSLISFFVLNLGLAIATFVADLCQCTPVSYYWNHYVTDTYDADGNVTEKAGTCIRQVDFFLITAGLSVLTDILIMVIPAAMIWGLKMQKSKKIAVWAVMSLGWVVAIIGAARIVLYYYRFQPSNIDRSYSVAYTISGAEVNIAIIASSGPALKAFANKYIPSFLSTSKSGLPSRDALYSPRGYARSSASGLSGYSRHVDKGISQPERSGNGQYGMSILKTSRYDVDTSSQEAIVSDQSSRPRSEFEFGLQDDPRTVAMARRIGP